MTDYSIAEIAAAEIARSPGCSYWLKEAVRTATQRDALDALRDAETLCAVLALRAEEAFARTAGAQHTRMGRRLTARRAAQESARALRAEVERIGDLVDGDLVQHEEATR